PDGAAINNQCGKKVTVTVVDNTNNRLIDGATYEQVENEDMKGTFFSEGQLNFYGSGKLEIRAKYKHAICTDDYFRMYAGNIVILEAASDGIHANDYIRMDDGKLTIRSTGEGLDCEKGYVMLNGGTLDIKTTGEKAHGIKSKEAITVDTDGTINVEVSGLASKGFKSGGDMTVSKGTIGIVTTGGAFYDTEDADISSAAGIKCDGNLLVDKGTITINSSGEGGKGISVDGTLIVNDGTITVTTTGGQFVYGSDDTAAKAIKSDGDLTVNGGTIIIKTSGVEAEGLESKATLTITGGLIEIEAYDDCINASTHIEITGGMVYCKSQVNDAIDSNGTLTISGGVVVAAGASAPEGGIDCDQSRFIMSGGTVIGIGGATSSPTTNVSTQRSLVYSPTSSSVQIIRIESSAGDEVLTFKLPVVYNQNMTMLFSSPSLVANTSYTIYTGGSISGGTDFHGLYTGATYTKGTSAATFTTSAMVTTVGNSNNPGVGGPGRP
ncbi:carbohydrate-binding domain-containing protein, partial [Porphyromonadaceae bacterium OttesenSCG-928-L07]|nr:carbohydrate-binding domain-containing protein [Porphyromonadaceae bacterium OttesenSCG-928-L07]